MDTRGNWRKQVVSVKLYVEGGGDSKQLRSACRKGFQTFIERAGLKGRMPRIVACGGRGDAFDDFKTSHAQGDAQAMLLVDAEGPVTAATAWLHLQARDGWSRPPGAADDQCHLMVQIMESWFLADTEALEAYFGQGFRRGALPGNNNIETVPKQDVLSGLDRSTTATGRANYHKARDSFKILATIDPDKVTSESPHAARLIDALLA